MLRKLRDISDTLKRKILIKKIKNKYFPNSDYTGPCEKHFLMPLGVFEEQWLWSKRKYFKGVCLDMSNPKYVHHMIYEHPDVEKVLISNLSDEVVVKLNRSSKVDIIADFCADNLPVEKETFDTIFCISILEHCESPEKMIKNLSALLKPHGHLFVWCPYAYMDGHMEQDYWRIGISGYKLLAKKAGLDVVEYGNFIEMGKYFKQEIGRDFSIRRTAHHHGVPVINWAIMKKA